MSLFMARRVGSKTVMTDSEYKIEKGQTPSALSWSLVAGFIAWGLDLSVSYTLRDHACSIQARYLLHAVTFACLPIALSGAIFSWHVFRRLPADKTEEGGNPHDRAHFQALLGIGFSLGFAAVVAAAAIPRWILPLCN
jgi:hypothetical protein